MDNLDKLLNVLSIEFPNLKSKTSIDRLGKYGRMEIIIGDKRICNVRLGCSGSSIITEESLAEFTYKTLVIHLAVGMTDKENNVWHPIDIRNEEIKIN
jgi:hypothetical protein